LLLATHIHSPEFSLTIQGKFEYLRLIQALDSFVS